MQQVTCINDFILLAVLWADRNMTILVSRFCPYQPVGDLLKQFDAAGLFSSLNLSLLC